MSDKKNIIPSAEMKLRNCVIEKMQQIQADLQQVCAQEALALNVYDQQACAELKAGAQPAGLALEVLAYETCDAIKDIRWHDAKPQSASLYCVAEEAQRTTAHGLPAKCKLLLPDTGVVR